MNKTYFKLIGASVVFTMVISLFSAAGIAFTLSENGVILCQIAAFMICGTVSFFYMKKKDPTFKQFGFKKVQPNKGLTRFIILVILIQPAILGINFNLSFSTLGLIVLQMLLVGLVEETFFRGIFFYALKNHSPKVFITFSSIVFGLLHMASSLNPETALILVILQVLNAVLLGLVFSVIYYMHTSIYTVIFFHGLFNVFAAIANAGSIERNIVAVLLLSICYILFLIYYSRVFASVKKSF